jgi:hypothetical protein
MTVERSSSPAFHIDVETTALHEPVWLDAKLKVDMDLVLKSQQHGQKPLKGIPVGQMMEFWPHDALKREVLAQCQIFLRHMRQQGYEPRLHEHELLIWGPFRERVNMRDGASLVNIEEGNPFYPGGAWAGAAKGVWKHDLKKGPRRLDKQALAEHDWKHGGHFRVRGLFTAKYGKQEETTGSIIV